MQEHDNHNHDKQDGLQQRVHHRFHRCANEARGIIINAIADTRREALAQLGHGSIHVVGRGEGVRSRQLEHTQRDGVFTIHVTLHGVVARAEFDSRHVFDTDHLAIAVGLDDDVAKLLRSDQPALGGEGVVEACAPRGGHGSELPGSHLHILFANGPHDVAGSEIAAGDSVWIKPDAHRKIQSAQR